ncbi:MAG: GtrA family protein [Clostridium sp.]|nr:GtrA family protein [Clostridium sp.]
MLDKIREKCVNYETVSYLICGILTTAVDFGAYSFFRETDLSVELSQALSWLVAVFFAYVVNKLVVFRNFNMRPVYMAKEAGAFVAARAFSGILTWIIMIVLVRLGGDRGFLYELFCKFIVSVINMVLNYVFSKLWIFKKKPE